MYLRPVTIVGLGVVVLIHFVLPSGALISPIPFKIEQVHSFCQNRQVFSVGINLERRRGTELLGIRGFRGWFEETFPDAVTTLYHPPKRSSTKPTTKESENFSTDYFEHVLIDINQLLHIALRRSRTNSHALTLLIQELDKCTDIAKPTKSIVLAFDGPPAAAKLATQRRRRYGTVVRGERKRNRLQRLIDRGVTMPSTGTKKGSYRRSGEERDEATLAITPGTDFMDRACEATLYWAWQRYVL